jgi:hypothetical protein
MEFFYVVEQEPPSLLSFGDFFNEETFIQIPDVAIVLRRIETASFAAVLVWTWRFREHA